MAPLQKWVLRFEGLLGAGPSLPVVEKPCGIGARPLAWDRQDARDAW